MKHQFRLHIDLPLGTDEERAAFLSNLLVSRLDNVITNMHDTDVLNDNEVEKMNYRLGNDEDRQKSNYLMKTDEGHIRNKKLRKEYINE